MSKAIRMESDEVGLIGRSHTIQYGFCVVTDSRKKMNSTKVKTVEQINDVRLLYEQGIAIRQIAACTRYSRNTVKKIIRRIDGYERDSFSKNWGGRQHWAKQRINLNGKMLHIQNGSSDGYPRVSVNGRRRYLHIYLAQEIFHAQGKPWPIKAIVHHIDYDSANFSADNLSVFSLKAEHRIHHACMEQAMFKFLRERNLLCEFYETHPNLKVETLRDNWPVNFDPVWLESCDGFEQRAGKDKP